MTKLTNPVHPGKILAEEFLMPIRLDIVGFSAEAGIDVTTVDELIEGRIGVTDILAAKLAAYWRNSAEFWLKLQEDYDKSTQRLRGNDMKRNADHPDKQAIDDWFIYGPKDKKIEELVRELTLGRDLRLAEVENLIVAALEQKKQYLQS